MTIEQKNLSKSFLIYMSLFFITQLSLLLSATYVSAVIACTTAVIWMIISIPVYCLFKKLQYFKFIYPILNAFIAGITISAYYTIENVKLQDSLLWIFAPLVLYIISFLIVLYLKRKKASNHIEIINLSSLIMFGGVFLIVLLVITEGDAIEILELTELLDRKKNTIK